MVLQIYIQKVIVIVLSGKGFGLKEAKPSIQTVFNIRNATPIGITGDYHPLLKK